MRLRRRLLSLERRVTDAEAGRAAAVERLVSFGEAAREAEALRERAARLAGEHAQRIGDLKVRPPPPPPCLLASLKPAPTNLHQVPPTPYPMKYNWPRGST